MDQTHAISRIARLALENRHWSVVELVERSILDEQFKLDGATVGREQGRGCELGGGFEIPSNGIHV